MRRAMIWMAGVCVATGLHAESPLRITLKRPDPNLEEMPFDKLASIDLPAGEGEMNPLKALAGRMEDVRGELERSDTGPVVQMKIGEILDEIDRLLASAEKPPPGPGPEGPPSPEGPTAPGPDGPPATDTPTTGLTVSRRGDRSGDMKLAVDVFGTDRSWKRVPIDPEKSPVLKAREGVTPPEYETYVSAYFSRLARGGSGR